MRSKSLTMRGFTLVELLVVFALGALLVGLAPVAFGRLTEAVQYRDTVRALLNDFRAARLAARSQGHDVRFVVNLSQRTFGVEGGAVTSVPPSLQLHAVTATQEAGGDGTVGIRFLPKGGASGGSVDVVRGNGDGVRLRVDWFSARIEQERLQP